MLTFIRKSIIIYARRKVTIMANYGANGWIDFSRLWTLMEKKKLNKQWLKNNGIHSNTVAKLTKNENVTCEVICNLCRLLDCQPGEIMEYKREKP